MRKSAKYLVSPKASSDPVCSTLIDSYRTFWKSFGIDERLPFESTYSQTMDEDTAKRLIRLKRHEAPPEGYFDAFLTEFHHRQRKELLHRSSLSLFMERLNTYLADPRSQGWAFAPVAAVFLVAFYIVIGMTDDSPLPVMPTAQIVSPAPQDYLAAEDISHVTWRGPVTLLGNDRLTPETSVQPAPVSSESFGEGIRLNLSSGTVW